MLEFTLLHLLHTVHLPCCGPVLGTQSPTPEMEDGLTMALQPNRQMPPGYGVHTGYQTSTWAHQREHPCLECGHQGAYSAPYL